MRHRRHDYTSQLLADALKAAPDAMFMHSANSIQKCCLIGVIQTAAGQEKAPIGCLCRILIYDEWFQFMPKIHCIEPWIRRGSADWHIYSDGSLCWDLKNRWHEHIASIPSYYSMEETSTHSAAYLLNSVRSLLAQHYIAWQLNLLKWPSEWPQWSHNQQGVLEYNRMRNK